MSQMKAPRGTHDLFGTDHRSYDHIQKIFFQTAENYSFAPISTPIFEFLSVFDRTLGADSDIVSKEMYVFSDRGGDTLSLRPEGTAGVVRAFLTQSWQRETPLKLYYSGPMFRYERPQKGRFRQFHQMGVEVLGVDNPMADAEVICLGQSFLRNLGLSDKIDLEINSLGKSEDRKRYREALVQYFVKYENELSQESKLRLTKNPLRILDSKDANDGRICESAPRLSEFIGKESQEAFELIQTYLTEQSISYKVNPRLVRGLDYYNDVVFEFKTSHLGSQDAVLSGGRYDGLVETMGGSPTPGVGFAAGAERLMLLLEKPPGEKRPVVMIPLSQEAQSLCFGLAEKLRQAGVKVDHTYSGNLSKRMKRATKLSAKWVVVIGDEELKTQSVTLKDFDSGEQIKVSQNELLSRVAQDL